MNKAFRFCVALVLPVVMVLASLSGTVSAVESSWRGANAAISMKEEKASSASQKIDTEVSEVLEKHETVQILIEMTEQVDTKKASIQAVQGLDSSATAYQEKIAARYGVFNALKNTALKTQAPILQYLEQGQMDGRVKEYDSFYIMNVIYAEVTKDVVEELSFHPEVARISLDEFIEIDWPELYDQELHTDAIEWNIDRVNAPDVWNSFGIDGTGVVIGIIDTGADWQHDAIQRNWRGFNPDDPDNPVPYGNWLDCTGNSTLPADIINHGTHVTGTILGQDSSGENIIGVAPGAQWIAARAFTVDGGARSDLLASAQYMLAPEDDPSLAPDIIQNSWGGSPGVDEWYRPMVQAWRDAGQLPVFSAGNDGPGASTVTPPANYPESYAVASVDSNDQVASSSSRGPSQYDGDQKPNISAPGVAIRSSIPGGGYGRMSGTSMASPHVSGTAALLLSANLSLSVDDIESIMNDTAEPLTDEQYTEVPNDAYGVGMVNAFEAVASMASGIGAIEGTVTREGTDSAPPVIEHEPLGDLYGGLAVPLTASVRDDVSVLAVELWLAPQDSEDYSVITMNRIAGDYRQGEYQAIIPPSLIIDPGFDYFIQARDYGGHVTQTEVYSVDVLFGIEPGMSWDFESHPLGWYMDGDWQWGEPLVGPAPLTGTNLIATNLQGNYTTDIESWLISPPLDLRNTSSASFQVAHWYDIENNYDEGLVAISADGEVWEVVNVFTGRNQVWEDLVIDLGNYCGSESQVYVAFIMSPDYSVNYPGWYIDSVDFFADANSEGLQTTPDGEIDLTVPAAFIQGNADRIEEGGAVTTEQGLPLDSIVTVLETNRTTRTNPSTGAYRLVHPAGKTWTVRAESYGFYPATQEISLEAEQTAQVNFMLEPMPRGDIQGAVVNGRNGEPIADARVRVIEDPRIEDAIADADGRFNMDVLEGEYTLVVFAAGYHSMEVSNVEVRGGEITELTIEMRPFIGYEEEIAYDDGSAENARAFYDPGNGWAMRMTPDGNANLLGANLYFWPSDWPVPGGNEFKVAVFDTDDNGEPGDKILETDILEGVRGEWNYVDLSEYGFVTNRDFFLVMIQPTTNTLAPGMGMDESGPFADRSYMYLDGHLDKLDSSYGNIMIRANVAYSLEAPIIDVPEDMTYTNEDAIVVSGTTTTDSVVTIYNNDEAVAIVETEGLVFSAEIPLTEGDNVIFAEAEITNGVSDPSEPVIVIKDTVAPELSIDSPGDGYLTNRETVTVEGAAVDEHMGQITINSQQVDVAEDGSYTHRVILDDGVNVITVIAEDLAGNVSEVSITVYAQFEAAAIENVLPAEDIYLQAGQTVQIEFTSDPGLDASFVIYMPLTNLYQPNNVIEMPMFEQEEGRYVGNWTATSAVVEGAVIEVRATDSYGNIASEYATGKLYLNLSVDPPGPPKAHFDAPQSATLGVACTFDASESEADGEIVEYAWDFGDGQTATGAVVEHAFKRPGNRKVTLTITDEFGGTDSITLRVFVKPNQGNGRG